MKKSRPPIQREKSNSYVRSIFVYPGLQSTLPPFDIRGLSEISFFLEGQDRPRPPPMATCPSWIYLLYFFSGSKYLAILGGCAFKSTFEHKINDRHESIVGCFRESRSEYLQRKRDLNEKQLSCPSPPVRSCYSRSLLLRLSFSYYYKWSLAWNC